MFTDSYGPNTGDGLSSEEAQPSDYFTLGNLPTEPSGVTLGTPTITYDSTNNDFVITDTISYTGQPNSLSITPPTVSLINSEGPYTISGSNVTVDVSSIAPSNVYALENSTQASYELAAIYNPDPTTANYSVTVDWGDGRRYVGNWQYFVSYQYNLRCVRYNGYARLHHL